MINYDQFLVENADRVEVVLHRLSTNLAFFKEEGLEPVIRQMYWNVNVVAFFSFLRFRSVYEPLHYLLTRESDVKTMRFISTDRHLLEYGRELQKVYDLTNMAASMDLFIPMELFVLDCAKIKEVRYHQRQWTGVYAPPPLLKAKPLFSNLFVIVSLKC